MFFKIYQCDGGFCNGDTYNFYAAYCRTALVNNDVDIVGRFAFKQSYQLHNSHDSNVVEHTQTK